MRRLALLTATVVVSLASITTAGEIGYVEDYVLARDRAEALKLLIPGSEDYYYYHCLYFQSNQQFDKVEELLALWVKRYNYTERVREIQNRQALLTYERSPRRSLEWIRQRLKLRFNHQRQSLGETPSLPTALDQALIDRSRLRDRALRRYKNLNGFEDRSLGWLIRTELDTDRRRDLLGRLPRPDHQELPKLVAADLNHLAAKPFGSMTIHGQLLRPQLDELVRLKPELLNQSNFVNVYLSKLRPADDADWRTEAEQREAYLTRLWEFVSRLAPAHNSLKAHVLYHRLQHDRGRGQYSKARFLDYLRLPRNVHYMNRKYLASAQNRRHTADLNANYQKNTGLPSIGDDEPLVRSYFQHFFVAEATTRPYGRFVDDTYLRHQFAEAKIVNGLGEPERWYSLLPPAKYQALKERIDLDFVATNNTQFSANAPVTLELDIKNVETLIVKVFEINAGNYYRQHGREVNTDINLDGLVANRELTFQYSDPPLRRIRRRFEFPQLARPGVYVVDFIGNGLSSRAVIRKGSLQHLVRVTTAGHLFTILDDQNRKVNDATLWLAGRQYEPNKQGQILVPYSPDRADRQPIILTRGDFSSLAFFGHRQEKYGLRAAFHIDRESLLERASATLLVRPGLTLNGTPVTLSVLRDTRLRITAVDRDGVASTKEVKDFKLFEDRESVYELQVPPRLAQLSFELTAKVSSLTGNGQVSLSAQGQLEVNQIALTEHVDDVHLVYAGGGYHLELRGRTGEPKADRAVQVSLKHRDFRDSVDVSLQSDRQGRIQLGELRDIETITASRAGGNQRRWQMSHDRHTYQRSLHGIVGRTLEIPFMPQTREPLRDQLSLLEQRGRTFVADRFSALSIRDGMLEIKDLPAGDYDLQLKESGERLRLRMVEGSVGEGYALGRNRHLELRTQKALQIARLTVAGEDLQIRLKNAGRHTRVHLFAARYEPALPAYRRLATIVDREPLRRTHRKTLSLYAAGRNIGDEYQYIIDRKYARKFPGVMLDRPSILLNPWAIRGTETGQQNAQEGTGFEAQPNAEAPSSRSQISGAGELKDGDSGFSNLDFLAEASTVLVNLMPDENGLVTVPLDTLNGHPQIHVVAIDPVTTVYRKLSLPDQQAVLRDLRLAKGLDPERHFTQQKKITVLGEGETFSLDDITTSQFEIYDSLARVYALYTTLSHDPHLAEFGFLLTWPDQSAAEKKSLYSKHACHELNFFLFRKDPEFFTSVVQPLLEHKKDKTFLDDWLLERGLEAYVLPWAYEQLNVVERILLSQRLAADRDYTRRDVLDRFALLPANIDRFNQLFQTAILSSSLDANDRFGLAEYQNSFASGLNLEVAPMEGGLGGGGGAGMRGYFGGRQLAVDKEKATKLGSLRRRSRGLEKVEALGEASDFNFDVDHELRESARQLYRKLDKTQEWVENNYYQLPIEQQNGELVTVNAFWRDYAQHDSDGRFYSTHLATASGRFSEMMFAMSVLDLPFESADHDVQYQDTKMTLTAASPCIVFHEEIREAASKMDQTPILVSENFFQRDDRYRHENNERRDKFVTDEFLVHTVYGCQVVATNPTSSPQKLDVLIQIPAGAVSVLNGQATKSVHIQLDPYNTQTIEYFFYFPAAGRYPHYPVQVAKNEDLLAAGERVQLNVVEKLSRVDRGSWNYVSQNGSDQDVLDFLRSRNLHRLDLTKIAFRMADKPFFLNVVELLRKRHRYEHLLWSYGIKHNDVPAVRQFLEHEDAFVQHCGLSLDSSLLEINPVVRKTYQHMDYRPLVNARTHRLGRRRQILNDRLFRQYHQLLNVLTYNRGLDNQDRLAVTYYLLLQDRIEEALDVFAEVDPDRLKTRIQYDYFTGYLAMYNEDTATARRIADKYSSHPVEHWKNTFVSIGKQLDEIEGGTVEVVDPEKRNQTQTQLAATEPSLDFKVESKEITVNYQNLSQVEVNYYLMDIELLYSRNPFVQRYLSQFSNIRPNRTEMVELDAGQSSLTFALPEELHNSNVLVEIRGSGETKTQTYYSNSLSLQVVENYGQLRVTHAETGKPLSTAYVKVYARLKSGEVRFYKDGYTDLRGRFDYASLSTNEHEYVDKFSLLVLSEDHGAVVREASAP